MKSSTITVAQSNAFVTTFDLSPTGSGPLDGLRFSVKDTIDVAGFKTGCGNPTWRDSHPAAVVHAVCVEQLFRAGARCVGQTISDELALSLLGENYFYGTPLNPRAPQRVPGGSSSGSASAVACGLVDFALGTDTGGSTRVPASNCGIWGFRPSHGFVSVAGVNPLASSFDTVGVLAQSADVLAKVGLVLLAGAPLSASKPATIYLIREAFALADTDVQGALSEPKRRLREIFGDIVRESSLQELVADDAGRSFAPWADTFCVIQWAEIKSCLGAWIANARPEFGPEIAASFQLVDEVDRRRGGNATTRTIFSKFARISRTGRSAVHPNNTGACAAQGRSTQTQFEWKRLLSSHIGSNEHCRHRPTAASVPSNSRRRRRISGLVVTREAWTGFVVVAGGEEYWSRNKSALNDL
jgi:amidase